MTNLYVIDRFEGDYAVCEHDGAMVQLPRVQLPDTSREGDVIRALEGVFCLDAARTEARRAEIRRLVEDIFGFGESGVGD